MQRDWNQKIESAFAEPFIVESREEPARHQMAQMHLPAVFEIEDHPPNNPAAAIGGDRRIEVDRAVGAIRTSERPLDCAGKWFRAFCAKWRNDSCDLRLA